MRTKIKLNAIQWGILALIPFLFALFVIRSCSPKENQMNLTIINQGERTMGTITSIENFIGYEHGSEIIVKYTFVTSSGQELPGDYLFPKSSSSEFHVGDQLEIAYDSKDPSFNLPVMGKEQESTARRRTWLGIILVAIVLCGMAGFLGYGAWDTWRLQKKYHL